LVDANLGKYARSNMSRAAQKTSDEPKQLSPMLPATIMNFNSE
jgi:hypothetical protein